MELSSKPTLAITYKDDGNQDGACSQLLRIYGIYALSRLLGVPYVHSPIAHLGYHGLSALENNAPLPGLLQDINRVFDIPSDIELPEKRVIHDMVDADVESIQSIRSAEDKDGNFNLIRILYPFPVTDENPEMYRFLRAVSPFPYRRSEVFRLAVHVRRGELYAIYSDWMLPNSYYVGCMRQFQSALRKLDIPFVCELYTEVASKTFEVTPQHHGIHGRISENVTFDPAMNRLEDFNEFRNIRTYINFDPVESLRRMASADALIISHSSFSYLPAVLNPDRIVVYHPYWRGRMKDWLVSDDKGTVSESELVERLDAWKRASVCIEDSAAVITDTSGSPIAQAVRQAVDTSSRAMSASLQKLDVDVEGLLLPFVEQSVSIRSIVALGCREILGIGGSDLAGPPPIGAGMEAVVLQFRDGTPGRRAVLACHRSVPEGSAGEPRLTMDSLAREIRDIHASVAGDDLLLLPSDLLNEHMTPLADHFSFRAVAVVSRQTSAGLSAGNAWKLRRSLFDRGLVCVGSVSIAGCKALCFLASEAIRSFNRLDVEPRGHITMATLREHAGFANQLWRYACVKLYALRHGLSPAFPAWEGNRLFGLQDGSCEGLDFPRIGYPGFADNDRELWYEENPPIDIDLHGFFQEIPECWRKHRAFLRNMFQLSANNVRAIDAWRDSITDGGRRTLVVISVRRGDYRNLQVESAPYFRLVPEQWYLDWLRALWPTVREPLLFVATDEPETIRPLFQEFETVPGMFGSMPRGLPHHVSDFEILRRADYLAICNSSFPRMAAILAMSPQKCFLPSFATQSFEPYEPWMDPAFWARFANSWRDSNKRDKPQAHPLPATQDAVVATSARTAIFLDVSDLLLYLVQHVTLSGIQRVECEILRCLIDVPDADRVRLVILDKGGGLGTIAKSPLLDIIADICSGAPSRSQVQSTIQSLLGRAVPCAARSGDIFLALGAFWNVQGMGRSLQALKNTGAIIGVLIHDLLPVDAPEYFDARTTTLFVKSVIEVLTFADFILTTSEYNQASLTRLMAAREIDAVPVHLLPLARERSSAPAGGAEVSKPVQALLKTEYVLCVGTIEVRKNPTYLFHIWKMLLESNRSNIPTLVFAGRKGWLVRDFTDQLVACNALGGAIVMLHTATDVELDLLYRHCLLTMFPSFAEGWGLPVGESLGHGKVCLCSAVGGIPEAGGPAADYLDPYNVRDGFERLTRYLDSPELRRDREREIVERFEARSWRMVADDLLRSTLAIASGFKPSRGTTAIRMPSGHYLPIGSGEQAATLSEAIAGALSAELICISGWHPPDQRGARAAATEARIEFRAVMPAGAKIVLAFRLFAHRDPVSITIRSGSGAETQVSLASGVEQVGVLSCEIEANGLVTAQFLAPATRRDRADAHAWSLVGLLYFDPTRLGLAAAQQMQRGASGGGASRDDRIQLCSASMDDRRRAASLNDFVKWADCWWPSASSIRLAEPLFADDADRRLFASGQANTAYADFDRRDAVNLIRRSDLFLSTARFSEGSLFDRSGVWRAMGYLQGTPPDRAPWLSIESDRLHVSERALAAAPRYEGSYLVFYNGNLHNYYHWLAEGLLGLDVLAHTLGPQSDVRIALPKSMDIAAVLDHRCTLHDVGLDKHPVTEIAENLIRVDEAIWVDSDLVQTMPAPYLKAFQRRVAGLYTGAGAGGSRRLLVARRGPTRTLANLAQVEALLSRYGFETVYLEGLSMAEQIMLFRSAEFVVGAHGAGMANLLFCEAGTKVIELMPTSEFRPFFWIISAKLDLVHGIQFCPTVAHRRYEGFQGALTVDVGKLRELVLVVDAGVKGDKLARTSRG